MGLLSKLFKNSNDEFNQEEYDRYNNSKIEEFAKKYDLSTIEGINAIPIQEALKYPDGGRSVVYMPEQILNRKASEYKKNEKYDLAIACLKKVNELYPYSFYHYTRENYERVVDMMVLAKQFKQAKEVHSQLDIKHGTRLQELKELQDFAEKDGVETRESYQKRIIDPYLDKEKDREQYYWLLEHVPSLAPKSFGGYRKMKKLNSINYQKIISELSKLGYDIDTIRFWN